MMKIAPLAFVFLAAPGLANADGFSIPGESFGFIESNRCAGSHALVANGYHGTLNIPDGGEFFRGTVQFNGHGVETVFGRCSADGTLYFDRLINKGRVQTYHGSYSFNPGAGTVTLSGTFSHIGQGSYPWSAEGNIEFSGLERELYINGHTWSGILRMKVDSSGAVSGSVHYTAVRHAEAVTGTFLRTSTTSGVVTLRRHLHGGAVQDYEGDVEFEGSDVSIVGSFTHNGAGDNDWFAHSF